jgi:phosphodiesterase/alkaline phosphatase D-like protein
MSRTALMLVVGLAVALLRMTVAAADHVRFTHGVASGDVTHSSAVVWTRVDRETPLKLELATDPAFHNIDVHRTAHASATSDFTLKIVVTGLLPDQRYFYRWRHGAVMSDIGTFRTAPLPSISASVRFAYSGDSDGTRVGSAPAFNGFEVLDAVRAERPDFFIYLGDTIYADSAKRAAGPATTLDEYRAAYLVNRETAALPALLEATSTYALWDDHEFRDDSGGQSLDQVLYATGRQAFMEYMPVEDVTVADPSCAGNPRFRVVPWGKDVDLMFLDLRSCRSPEVKLACEFAPGHSNAAPTLPAFLRSLPAFAPFFPAPPSSACLAGIVDPARTMLGSVQKERFKKALLESTARFKFVVNEVEIGQSYVFPYDRWEGYAAERAEILRFIRDHAIEHVVFLTTDSHLNLIRPVFIDRFADAAPIATEVVTGPIAYFTWAQLVSASAGGGAAGAGAVAAVEQILSLVGAECRNLNTYSYAVVDVDAATGTATFTLKDQNGHAIRDDVNPATVCTKTIGP